MVSLKNCEVTEKRISAGIIITAKVIKKLSGQNRCSGIITGTPQLGFEQLAQRKTVIIEIKTTGKYPLVIFPIYLKFFRLLMIQNSNINTVIQKILLPLFSGSYILW